MIERHCGMPTQEQKPKLSEGIPKIPYAELGNYWLTHFIRAVAPLSSKRDGHYLDK
ncbi:hypothetical protein MTBLM1_20017 [Rhodospirillaceae bacterium LM-1]|nr:hypothetical protein MTBLM1_20017 [Rhodospirillaceae bacterium LM-1]